MAMTMAEFLTLADADLDAIWMEEEREYEEQYSRILNIVDQTDLYKRDAKMAGFGPLRQIDEGADVTYDNAISPVTKRYDLVKRGLGYKITDKFWMFDRYGEVRQFESSLARADRDDTETFFFALINEADQTTYSTGFDGLALASNAHTRMDGGATQDNLGGTALSITGLEDAVISFTKFVDDRGRPYLSIPRTLLVPLDLRLVAREILGSTLRPDTANNNTNALVDEFDITTMVSPYLTSTTAWFLVGDNHDVNALWNMRPTQDSEIDFDSDTIKRKTKKWMGRGHGEWRDFYMGNT